MNSKCKICNSSNYTDFLTVSSMENKKFDESKMEDIDNFNIKTSRFKKGNLKGRLSKIRICDVCDNKIGSITLRFPFMGDNYPGKSRKCPECGTMILDVENIDINEDSGDFEVVMDGECINCGESYSTIILSDRKFVTLKYIFSKFKKKIF